MLVGAVRDPVRKDENGESSNENIHDQKMYEKSEGKKKLAHGLLKVQDEITMDGWVMVRYEDYVVICYEKK